MWTGSLRSTLILLMTGTVKKQPTRPLQGKVTVSFVSQRKHPEAPEGVQTEKDWTRSAALGKWEHGRKEWRQGIENRTEKTEKERRRERQTDRRAVYRGQEIRTGASKCVTSPCELETQRT